MVLQLAFCPLVPLRSAFERYSDISHQPLRHTFTARRRHVFVTSAQLHPSHRPHSHTAAQSFTPANTAPPRHPLRNALLAVLAALSTLTTIPLRPTVAGGLRDSGTTVAQAIPKRQSMYPQSSRSQASPAIRVKNRKEAAAQSTDSHGLGSTSFSVAATSALFASALAVAITHPIDTLKTRQQGKAAGTPTQPLTLRSLYNGVFSNIVKEAPNAAIYLACYEVFKAFLLAMPILGSVPLLAMCLAGMLGDAVGSVVRVPAEIINKRLQLGLNPDWNSAINEAFLSETGVESTIASWLAVLWRDVPYGGLQIAAYEFARMSLAKAGMTGLGFSIIAGSLAGLFAAVVTTPADVLVTRMSVQSPQCYLETRQYMSPSATFFRIVREEGWQKLWTGALHRGLFYMPMIGIFFAAYESFKYLICNPAALAGISAPVTALMGGMVASLGVPVHLAFLTIIYSLFIRRRISRQTVSS